jgi:23S rRNA (cytosine1962-C5)-methyltransferase
MHKVRVNRRAAGRVQGGHPWIFASDVEERGHAGAGETVEVIGPAHRSLGTAHYSSSSQITLRMLSGGIIRDDHAFYLDRIGKALEYRKSLKLTGNTYRLVHAEGDLLPGLIIDRYEDWCVIQTLSQGMAQAQGTIVAALRELLRPAGIVARNDAAVREHEQLPREKQVLHGELPEKLRVGMNHLRWRVDLVGGQKTGIFLDQRENYLAAAEYARGEALDCFTSTGGFALHMAACCASVEAADSSAGALSIAQENAHAAGIANVHFRQAGVFELLAGYSAARRRFDTIVLDPPAFAKSRSAKAGAVRGYREINSRALRLLNRGGVLITCSCSHHVSEAMLLEEIAKASLEAGRQLRIIERRTQGRDHPILLTVPETLYLKCLILQVLD